MPYFDSNSSDNNNSTTVTQAQKPDNSQFKDDKSVNMALIERWQTVLTQLKQASFESDRDASCVQLLAVSKTKPAADVATLAVAGQKHFGENYLQDALPKINTLKQYHHIVWHFIGHIQRNKTRDIAQNFAWVHTIERSIIAKRLNEQRPEELSKLNVLIQVNIDEEASKSGCLPTELDSLINDIKQYKKLELRGLMIIPATQAESSDDSAFVRTKKLFDEIKQKHPDLESWDTLSMGMSADMQQAVFAGSTMVRVGSAIFGKRI